MTELSGTLEGVGLPAMVRFLSGLNKTGCLHIVHQDWRGAVFFDRGRVRSASLGAKTGLAALDALVQALPGGTFTFESDAQPPSEPNLHLSQATLQAHLDELAAKTANGTATLPSLDAIPHVVAQDEAARTDDPVPLDRGTLQTLLAIDGLRPVHEIVAQRGTLDSLWQIGNLAELGLIRLTPAPFGTPTTPFSAPATTVEAPVEATRRAAAAVPAAAASTTPAAPAASPTMTAASAPAATTIPAAPGTAAAPAMGAASAAGSPTTTAASATAASPAADASPAAVAVPPAPVVLQAALETEEALPRCPRLGFEDDPRNAFGRPTRLHRCFAAGAPLPLSLDQQRELCLSDQFGTCPRLAMAGGGPRRGAEATAPSAARARAARAAVEPADADGRIVRLPFVARAAAAAESRSAAAAEPARLRPARDGAAPANEPTPLRARMQRATGHAATATGAATAEAPAARAIPATGSDAVENGAVRRAGRASGLARLPIQLISAVAVLVIVAGAIGGLLFLPQLNGGNGIGIGTDLLGDDSIDPSVLPNTSAIAAGTPVAGLATARPTTLPASGRDPAATVTAASSTASASATTAPTAAATTAAPAVDEHTLFDDSFQDNQHAWPNNPQGTAWLTGGIYRIATREAGQFVAIGVPLPTVLGDTIVSATFHKLSGPAGGGYGLIVRDQGPGPLDGASQNGRYYVIEAGDKGEVGMWLRDNDRWIDLLPWQRSDAVRTGTAINELTVRAIGDRLSLLVNGAEVATRTDATLPSGHVGLFVGGDGNQVAVEHLAIQTL